MDNKAFDEKKTIDSIELKDNGNIGANNGRRRSNAFSFSVSSDSNDECIQYSKHESLVLTKLQLLKHKDFVNEFRPKRDIHLFVSDFNIIFNCQELDFDSIIDRILSVSSCN